MHFAQEGISDPSLTEIVLISTGPSAFWLPVREMLCGHQGAGSRLWEPGVPHVLPEAEFLPQGCCSLRVSSVCTI